MPEINVNVSFRNSEEIVKARASDDVETILLTLQSLLVTVDTSGAPNGVGDLNLYSDNHSV